MKKIIILLTAIICLSSCSVVSTTLYGDITWMTDNGELVRSWKGAKVQSELTSAGETLTYESPFRNGGWFVFKTKNGEPISIYGGMAIIENLSVTQSIIPDSEGQNTEKKISVSQKAEDKEANELLVEYTKEMNTLDSLKKSLKKANKKDKASIDEEIKAVKKKVNDISYRYFKIKGHYPYADMDYIEG